MRRKRKEKKEKCCLKKPRPWNYRGVNITSERTRMVLESHGWKMPDENEPVKVTSLAWDPGAMV